MNGKMQFGLKWASLLFTTLSDMYFPKTRGRGESFMIQKNHWGFVGFKNRIFFVNFFSEKSTMKFPKMGGGSKVAWAFSKKTSKLGGTGTP